VDVIVVAVLLVVSCVVLVVMVDDKSIGVAVVLSDFALGGIICPPRTDVADCKNRTVTPNCRFDRAKDTILLGDAATRLSENVVDTPKKKHDAKISNAVKNNNESLGRIKIPFLLFC
jgi:hypothetical protein